MLRRRPGGLPYPRVRLGAPPLSTDSAPIVAPNLFQPSYRPSEIEGEYSRTNHQLYFQIARAPAVSSRPFLVAPAYRFSEPEGEYSRANHQLYWQIGQRSPARGNALLTYYSAPNRLVEVESEYARAAHQTYFQIARQLASAKPPLALTLFRISYRSPDVEADYQRSNHSLLFQFVPAAVVVSMCWSADSGIVTADSGIFTADSGACPIAPPSVGGGGGLLPGVLPCPPDELGKGMGPYKRPGQVFGEPDPLSPRLSSRAEVAAQYAPRTQLTQQLPLIEFPAPLTLAEQDDTDTVVFALVALDELCGSPIDVLRGPLTLRIVRRKV